ncbi:hypothetical protein [Amycolatopsis sp. FDAARGOS 1241]|uniref:hypothetical protein n=1 Tax=Amycolatopsis sp. FDAARGOS 1241 TaxID=2778070 RepID=UPI00194E7586|nr:hypothetical protein [Amycolatopsis sp. FDAARGOS 1241]QRP47756.1 hypothetical protein I6J71_07485 [Amycolatopsis sp. FDAARGOS 1241]
MTLVAAKVFAAPASAAATEPTLDWKPCAEVFKDWADASQGDTTMDCATVAVPVD